MLPGSRNRVGELPEVEGSPPTGRGGVLRLRQRRTADRYHRHPVPTSNRMVQLPSRPRNERLIVKVLMFEPVCD